MSDAESLLDESWRANAGAWTRSVREGRIESRRRATDRAVIDAVLRHEPARVLDVGCGEGWLARALTAGGADVVGFDGSAELVASARDAGGGRFHHLSYAGFAAEPGRLGSGYDVVVCNFSLLAEDIAPVLEGCRAVLAPTGRLVIQTVHPAFAVDEPPYADGWREERFEGIGDGYRAAMPWYFRTFGSWVRALRTAGFALAGCDEPVHPDTARPLSLLLVAAPAPGGS